MADSAEPTVLPPLVQEASDRLLALGHRFYVAWHPDCPKGTLRPKTASRLAADWSGRRWDLFEGRTPEIVDVTAEMPALWQAALRFPPPARGVRLWVPPERTVAFAPPARLQVYEGVVHSVPGWVVLVTDVHRFLPWKPNGGEPCLCIGGLEGPELGPGLYCYQCAHPVADEAEGRAHAAATRHDPDWLLVEADGARSRPWARP